MPQSRYVSIAAYVLVAVVIVCKALPFLAEMAFIARWIDKKLEHIIARPFRPGLVKDFESHVQGAVVCTSCDSAYRADDHRLDCENCGSPLWLVESEANMRRKYVGSFPLWEALFDHTYGEKNEDGKLLWLESDSPTQSERFASGVGCNWCGQWYEERPSSASCTRCGGVLPLSTSFSLSEAPPSCPRKLPFLFVVRHFFRLNRMGIFGPIVGCCGLALYGIDWIVGTMLGLPLIVIGMLQTYLAYVRRIRCYRALRRGIAVEGKVETVNRIQLAKQTQNLSATLSISGPRSAGARSRMGLRHRR